jgi:hypothetical protein
MNGSGTQAIVCYGDIIGSAVVVLMCILGGVCVFGPLLLVLCFAL